MNETETQDFKGGQLIDGEVVLTVVPVKQWGFNNKACVIVTCVNKCV